MKFIFILIFIFCINTINAQSVNLNQKIIEEKLRDFQLLGNVEKSFSFAVRPIRYFDISKNNTTISKPKSFNIYKSYNEKVKVQLLPIDYVANFSSDFPFNRNNGILIPNKGFQHMYSPGLYFKLGPLETQFKPEFLYAQNDLYDGFWDEHFPIIISRRLTRWNLIDNPERFGEEPYRDYHLGQSYLRLNLNSFSIGYSTENIWWGPSMRNSIMMSNNAVGFDHISINSNHPIDLGLFDFEFQFITGYLNPSNFLPSYSSFKFASHLTFVPKNRDKRYFQGFNLVITPKFFEGFSFGFIRWVQAYNEFIEANNDFFPVFDNLIRRNDKYGVQSDSLEGSRDQAAGIFIRWLWIDSNAEIYAEYHLNDSKASFRDLLLDSDHSRASTIGIQKIFDNYNYYYKFNWEWTQLEQTASRLLRNAGSWYTHSKVRHGYTNRGEVLGAAIGPGSNSHYFAFKRVSDSYSVGINFEIVDQDNDFLYYAWEDSKDFRRYWKDYNFGLNFSYNYKGLYSDLNLIYTRSLNHQWALETWNAGDGYDYYIPGIDKNNFYCSFSLTIPIDFNLFSNY